MPSSKVTVTFRFPKLLNQNLKAYSVQCDTSQNEVAVRALTGFLKKEGIDVNVPPRFFSRSRRVQQVTPHHGS